MGIEFVILITNYQPMPSSKSTTSLNAIKKWAEEREGKPSKVKGTNRKGGALLRINFPDYSSEEILENIHWDEWYDIFRENKLEFVYQDSKPDGKEGNSFKLISKEK